MTCLLQMKNAEGNLDILKVIFLDHVTSRTQISLMLYPSANAA